MHGLDGGETGIDNGIAELRGPWPDDSWKGWWGDEPPYRTPVFVLTHHPRPPLSMAGRTEFHFVTEGIHTALAQATAVAYPRFASIYAPAWSTNWISP